MRPLSPSIISRRSRRGSPAASRPAGSSVPSSGTSPPNVARAPAPPLASGAPAPARRQTAERERRQSWGAGRLLTVAALVALLAVRATADRGAEHAPNLCVPRSCRPAAFANQPPSSHTSRPRNYPAGPKSHLLTAHTSEQTAHHTPANSRPFPPTSEETTRIPPTPTPHPTHPTHRRPGAAAARGGR